MSIKVVSLLVVVFSYGFLAEGNDTLNPYSSRANYTPEGKIQDISSIQIYETKNQTPTRLLFLGYDVFGMSGNVMQVADRVAEAGFRVSVPDFFRGQGWDLNDWPPKNETEFEKFFFANNGSWQGAKHVLQDLISHYKNEGISQFGMFGLCWGGRVTILACSEFYHDIKVGGAVHLCKVNNSLAEDVMSPVYLMPSMKEKDMVPFYDVLVSRFGKENVGHQRFDDMVHGFASAQGNFDDPLTQSRVSEVIRILRDYFNKRLPDEGL